jgi:hypothetical protein
MEVRPDLQVRAEIILQPEDGRWVSTPEELNNLADGLNSILQSSNPRAGWPFRLTLREYIGLFTPPSSVSAGDFPRDNYRKNDGRCPHRLRTPTARLQARKRSARRIAIAQCSRAAVALSTLLWVPAAAC